jgi:hypothetical protein
MVDDSAPEKEGRTLAWLLGAGALLAWFTMLWLMFGDVL